VAHFTEDDAAIPALMRGLTAVVVAVLDVNGAYRDGNRGFAYLLDRDESPLPGEQIDAWFVQPSFQSLLTATDAAHGEGHYVGLLSLGDVDRCVRTVRGQVQRRGDRLLLLAEHDVADLERLNATVLSLNEEMAEMQRDLVRTNRQLHRDKAEIRRLMLTDPLTGAANRRSFNEHCRGQIARIDTGDQSPAGELALIMADIDHFKLVNDRYGHEAGDNALIVFVQTMRERTRDDDLVVRLGGEEFCVVLPGSSADEAMQVAERIRTAFCETDINGIDTRLSSSFGVACWRPGQDVDDLLRGADRALYRAKHNGRNRVEMAQVGDDE
jgi:diguanylate cyclase (GGDEF)-like protein